MKYKILSLLFCLFSFISYANSNQPNIILLMTDDQGWFDVGFNGNNEIHTPHLDGLAKQGIIFNRFYTASPVCSPTRASVLTGRSPYRMNIQSANNGKLPLAEITLPELLKTKGYNTAHFGKWHLGTMTKIQKDSKRGGSHSTNSYSPPYLHGYDEYFATEAKLPTYDPMLQPEKVIRFNKAPADFGWKALTEKDKSIPYGTAYWVGKETLAQDNLSGDDSRIMMDRILPFIENSTKKQQPFFTTIWFHTPHFPIVAPESYLTKYKHLNIKQQLYYGTLTAMDEQVGRLWQKLEALNIADNTIIFFCSDNGPASGSTGSAGMFRGGKKTVYEGGVRVPAFMVWKNKIAGNQSNNAAISTLDYLPTLLNILDIEYPDDRILDGKNAMPLITKQTSTRNKGIGVAFKDLRAWIDDRYKLVSQDAGKTYELYDLQSDPKETTNIIHQQPTLANNMKLSLTHWESSVANSATGSEY